MFERNLPILQWDERGRAEPPLFMHLTVVVRKWARPGEQKVGKHHRFQRQADSLTDTQFAPLPVGRRLLQHRPSSPRPEGTRGGVKGYGWKKLQWWETVTAQCSLCSKAGAWHVEWTHSVRPEHSSQAAKLDPFPIHESQTSDSMPVKFPTLYVYQWAIAPAHGS